MGTLVPLDCNMTPTKRIAVTGPHLVFVSTTTTSWAPVFADKGYAEIVLQTLRESVDWGRFVLVGWVIMPSHIHLLIGMRNVEWLSKTVQSFKILTSKRIRACIESANSKARPGSYEVLYGESGFHLWQSGFDDLIIYSERQFRIKLDYIHNNPVRDGLVTNSTDWQNSSAGDWLLDQPGPLPIDKTFSWSR